MQCDIDILGEASNLAEIELILATTTTISKLGFKNFQIRINDRRILKAMAKYAGFKEEDYDGVFITLDKMDKIGTDGVMAELLEKGYGDDAQCKKDLDLFTEIQNSADGIACLMDKLGDFLDADVMASFREIVDSVKATQADTFELVFDPTLVRGMS
jgi:histidyl-tRNA synthetase